LNLTVPATSTHTLTAKFTERANLLGAQVQIFVCNNMTCPPRIGWVDPSTRIVTTFGTISTQAGDSLTVFGADFPSTGQASLEIDRKCVFVAHLPHCSLVSPGTSVGTSPLSFGYIFDKQITIPSSIAVSQTHTLTAFSGAVSASVKFYIQPRI
jgi:hypothetical protein